MNRPFLLKFGLSAGRRTLRPAGLWPANARPCWSGLLLCAGLIFYGGGTFAQCANNLSTRTYDTVLTGPGYGTYQLSFPQWNLDSGLLVSAKINALVNVQYNFSLKNVDVQTGAYTIWVGREDLITSSSIAAPYDNITEKKIGVYTLNPGDQVAMPPFPFLTNYDNTDSIFANTAPFLGVGRVNFTYAPITYTNIHASNNVSYSYHASATEVTRFSLTYTYCNANVILSKSLTAFTAVLKDPASVQLNWSVAGEEKDWLYEIQRSGNGSDFTTVGVQASIAGTADYMYVDRLAGVDMGAGTNANKYYYRLRIITPGGMFYSSIKEVGLDGQAKLMIYPNPAVSHINLVLPGDPSRPGDWRVDILTSDGRLVQRAEFFHTNSFFINFRQHLSSGVYFIRATDLLGHGLQTASFRADGR